MLGKEELPPSELLEWKCQEKLPYSKQKQKGIHSRGVCEFNTTAQPQPTAWGESINCFVEAFQLHLL